MGGAQSLECNLGLQGMLKACRHPGGWGFEEGGCCWVDPGCLCKSLGLVTHGQQLPAMQRTGAKLC